MEQLRIVFAGTPEFAVPSLRALLDGPHGVLCVFTQPDRPSGRGRRLLPSPVKALALDRGIEVRQPLGLKGDREALDLASLRPDLLVVVAYGLLLPPRILAIPRLGCVNVHASLLPRWRGAAPIQRAIEAGDEETGVSIMAMDAGLDKGPVFLSRSVPIGSAETAGSLHDRLAEVGAAALMEALPGIEDGSLQPRPQDDSRATYAAKLTKHEAVVDWTLPAETIARRVRAFNPWPVAQTAWGKGALRIWMAEPRQDGEDAPPGAVIAATRAGLDVRTGGGVLRVTELQAPGGRVMTAAEFVNAHSLEGVVLG